MKIKTRNNQSRLQKHSYLKNMITHDWLFEPMYTLHNKNLSLGKGTMEDEQKP